MLHTGSVARISSTFLFGESQVPIETFSSPMQHSSIVARNTTAIEIFLNLMHHSSTVSRNKNMFFFQFRSGLIEFFISPNMHHSTVARNEFFFGGDQMSIQFLSCHNTLEAHLRPGPPYYDLLDFKAHLSTRGVLFKVICFL